MRRLGPRPLADALVPLRQELAPATTLARVQEAWKTVAGEAMGAEAEPVAEHAGKLTFACRSSVWASELSLMQADLVERLNDALGGTADAPPVRELRFVTQASRKSS